MYKPIQNPLHTCIKVDIKKKSLMCVWHGLREKSEYHSKISSFKIPEYVMCKYYYITAGHKQSSNKSIVSVQFITLQDSTSHLLRLNIRLSSKLFVMVNEQRKFTLSAMNGKTAWQRLTPYIYIISSSKVKHSAVGKKKEKTYMTEDLNFCLNFCHPLLNVWAQLISHIMRSLDVTEDCWVQRANIDSKI